MIRKKNRPGRHVSFLTEEDRKRRKREIILCFIIIATVSFLTFIENRLISFGSDFPVSNTILMFILINVNLLLLILLIFLVFRNIVKLLYDRKRKVMGTKLRTRLSMAFIVLTLFPTTVLFFFSINFVSTSIGFWFNVPVEQALQNSLNVGRELYAGMESRHRFFLERAAVQIVNNRLLDAGRKEELTSYVQVIQREFNLHAAEVYDRRGRRICFSRGPELHDMQLAPLAPDHLLHLREKIRTLSEESPYGELNRSAATVPFGVSSEQIAGYAVLSSLISADLRENLAAISRGYEEYQQIKLLKRPIQITYYITLSIVALLVLFCAVWFGFYLAKSISIPIRELAEGTRRVAEGDLGFSIAQVGDDEIGSLVESFNRMTRDLRANREQLELSARMLREQNAEIEERRQYMEIVLRNVSTGVITLDARGFVTTANTSAEKMLQIRARDIVKQNYRKLLDGEHLELAGEIMEKLSVSRNNAVQFSLRLTIRGRPRTFMVHINALHDDGGHHVGIVAVFDDLTDQEKAQRMAAWREVARRIAHEVKNPLTPIALSAQRLKRRYSRQIREDVFDECTRMIIDHVELIRNLVNEFSRFARFPTANPERCRLLPIIEETLALYREGHPDISFELNMPEELPPFNLDRQQIKQALINLADNAISAMKMKGTLTISLSHDPVLKSVRLEVADTGPGISDEDKIRLFEPYFSTKKTGMGLGLTIVSTIIADHKGSIRVQDNHPRGTKFVIELPM
ncbi:MAG: ATP-binding protein [Desulfococcaceae bacterium]|jgi:two-component system nitrogen regulation sensor histidine kinase NtrY|nr:ATP-binding protein [Desulfococcaceae bacterium]